MLQAHHNQYSCYCPIKKPLEAVAGSLFQWPIPSTISKIGSRRISAVLSFCFTLFLNFGINVDHAL
jgi:hypothetical protein